MEGAGAMTRGAARSADRAGAPPATVCESEPNRLRCGAPEDGKEKEKRFFLEGHHRVALGLLHRLRCELADLTSCFALTAASGLGSSTR